MSIVTEVKRITNAKESLKAKLIAKGVTVSKNAKLNECVDLVDEISSSNNGGMSLNAFLIKRTAENLFYNFINMDNADFMNYDDTKNVENFASAFYSCRALLKAPLLNTSSAKTFSNMFYKCVALTEVPNYDTSNVEDMSNLFYNCVALSRAPAFNTSKVKNFSNIFSGCTALTKVPNYDTSSAENIQSFFNGCTALTEVPSLNTSNVNAMSYAYYKCNLIKKVDISYYNIAASGKTAYWLAECYSLKAIIIRGFGSNYILNTSAFRGCYRLLGTTSEIYNPNGAKDCYIYVPSEMVNILKSATNWSIYSDQFRALEDYTLDGTTTGEFDDAKAGIS